jgi:preprotein translocase subunit YajC
MFIDTAYAMATPGGTGAQGLTTFIPFILIFVIFYFLLIRPQQKKSKHHQEFLNNLKAGDMVVTTGGLHGKISGLTDTILTLEIADKVRVKVSRSSITGVSELKKKNE